MDYFATSDVGHFLQVTVPVMRAQQVHASASCGCCHTFHALVHFARPSHLRGSYVAAARLHWPDESAANQRPLNTSVTRLAHTRHPSV